MLKELKPAVLMLAVFTLLTGGLYPAVITGIAQAVMPSRANGSLLTHDGHAIGSRLIGQPFSSPKYFWSRPSATSPYPYNAASSSGSNLGPTNSALTDAVAARVKALRDADPDNKAPVPVDLVTASASGLDPDISPAAAAYPVNRVARARGLEPAKVAALVGGYTRGRQLGVLGEPTVNVLELNVALDGLH